MGYAVPQDTGVTQVLEDSRVFRQTQVASCVVRGFIETTRARQVVGQVDSRQVKRGGIEFHERFEEFRGRWNTLFLRDRRNPRQVSFVCRRVCERLPREPFNLAELIVRQGSVDAVFV